MISSLRNRLRQVTWLHSLYMRAKRLYTGELVGMTSVAEQRYLEEFGEKRYVGFGEVVDLGCFLGSTTIPLARGLSRNAKFAGSGRNVHAYDTFVWYESMNDSVRGTDLFGKFRPGDSFLDEYLSRTKEFAALIEPHPGDLVTLGWDGGDIEFLLVDAMKNWDLTNSIFANFYPQLVPGRSLVFHQDFAHFFTGWIHLLHWRLRDHFEFVDDVPRSASVVFRYVKQIPDALFEKRFSFEDFSDSDVEAAFDHSLSLVSAEKHPNILAAKVMYLIHQQRIEDAQKMMDRLKRRGVVMADDLAIVENILAGR